MTKLKVTKNTIFKRKPIASNLLPEAEKVDVRAGTEFELHSYDKEKDHYRVALQSTSLKGFNTWYVYEGHVDIGEAGEIKLAVPFWKQTDNRVGPDRTCNTSSCAMVAKFLGAKIASDDEFYQYVIKYGDSTDHNAQTRALLDVGIKSQWRTDLGFKDLEDSLKEGLPVVIGILHRGTLSQPRGGHVLVIIGMTAKGDFIVNDPYGSLIDSSGAYTGPAENGKGAVYPRSVLDRRWTVSSTNDGWGRTFYGNK